MGSGDPSGLQNRRELALLALVSSTLTRFRQFQSLTGKQSVHNPLRASPATFTPAWAISSVTTSP
jgi:hypothetical protein